MRIVKQVPDQLRSGDGEDERAKLCRDVQELWPRALLCSGYSRVHGALSSEAATSPAEAGPPFPRGSQTRMSRNLCRAHPDSAWVWMPGTSLMESGWSHSSGTARSPHYSPVAVRGSVCTTESRHRRCDGPAGQALARVCTYLESWVPSPSRIVPAGTCCCPVLLPLGSRSRTLLPPSSRLLPSAEPPRDPRPGHAGRGAPSARSGRSSGARGGPGAGAERPGGPPPS